MNRLVKFVSVYLTSFFLFGCGKDNHCGETAGISRSGVALTFFSIQKNRYMYTDVPFYSLYNKDSLVIRDETGIKMNLMITKAGDSDTLGPLHYIFGVSPLYNSSTDSAAFNHEISKKFYISYNSIERDTIVCTFKAAQNECNSYFEFLKVYYKNDLVGSSNFIYLDVKLNRQ